MGFKVVRPVGEWAASSPTQLSVGGDPLDQNSARGNKRVLTSTLLFPADDSFRLMIAMLIQIGEFSPAPPPTERLQMWRLGARGGGL